MTKKYLSVEEAAQMLGLDPGEVLRYREQDKIRGFADRGTWKFKTEDVENFKRTLNSDSPTGDFPMLDDDSDNVLMDDDDLLADQPTIIRRGRPDDASSDSDVRLIFDGSPGSDMLPDSDSDVRLAGGSGSLLDSSDSDVKLVGGDETASHDASMSDVRLAAKRSSGEIRMSDRLSDSDSDVKLVGKSKSSAEMSFPGLDSKPGQDETIDLAPDNESVLEEDSGISLVGDSGISLERPDDSGISLTSDSALSLTSDSGISLDITSDSGISLDLAGSDIKGGRGKPAPKKPVKPSKPFSKSRTDSDLELGGTMPEMDIPLAGGSDDLIDTNVEVPLMDDDSHDSSYDLADSAGDTTSVITLDDDSQDSEDSASVDVIDGESFDEFSEEDDESVEVAGEIGEDDEIEEDVFGADDEDFDDSFTAGESQGELEFPTRGAPVAVEQEWGVGTFIGLALTSLCMVACGMVAYDLVLSMWQADVNGMNPATTMIGNMLFP